MTEALPAASATSAAPNWWRRPGLESRDGRLTIVGEDAEALARRHGTPLFVYDRRRYAENARRLQDAAARAGIPFRLRFALKANPLPEVLEVFRGLGSPGSPDAVGIDACSPGEVLRALECGWRADEISYTGTNVSGAGSRRAPRPRHPRQPRRDQSDPPLRPSRPGSDDRPADRSGGRAGYRAHLEYSGRPTKFGIGLDRLAEALNVACEHDLTIDTVHFHAGSGWLGDGLDAFEAALVRAVEATEWLISARCPIGEVNVGGGIGVPARDDEPAGRPRRLRRSACAPPWAAGRHRWG